MSTYMAGAGSANAALTAGVGVDSTTTSSSTANIVEASNVAGIFLGTATYFNTTGAQNLGSHFYQFLNVSGNAASSIGGFGAQGLIQN